MTNWLSETFGLTVATQQRLLATVITIALIVMIRLLIVRAVNRSVDDAEVQFRARRAITYVTTGITVLLLVRIWLSGFTEFATYLGIISAGIAIALSDVLKNLAGWVFIMFRRPFKLGDRIEIGPDRGDVIDIRVFRFSLLEIGKWVDADQSTGRIVHVPNGKLFTESMANYSEGFEFLWHEIPVMVTFESDWQRAEEIVKYVLTEHAPDRQEMAAGKIRKAAERYFIRYRHLTPTVYVSVRDSGVLLTGRLLTAVRERRTVDNDVWREILLAFAAEPSIELAYPTVRTFFEGPIDINRSDTTP